MNNYNLKKFSLFVILDAYITKYAIEDFIIQDTKEVKDKLLIRYREEYAEDKISEYLLYLKNELTDINKFLEDTSNIHWTILEKDKEFFDKNLPKYKRKIQWFRSVDRYPFDYNVFFYNNK